MLTKIRLLLVEDDLALRELLETALAQAEDMKLIGQAASVAEAMQRLQNLPAADVMLVDLGLPDGSGIELIRACRQAWPDCQSMVFTVFGDETNIVNSIAAGASGYLLKDYTADQLIQEVRSLHAGGSPISPLIARQLLLRMRHTASADSPENATEPIADGGKTALSSREMEVLNAITYGFSYGEIAEKLGISHHTVRTFVRRIYRKFEVKTRIEAINKARAQGLLP